MLNSESIVIIRIKGEHLLYSKISGGIIGYGWGNVCYIVNFSPGGNTGENIIGLFGVMIIYFVGCLES